MFRSFSAACWDEAVERRDPPPRAAGAGAQESAYVRALQRDPALRRRILKLGTGHGAT
jgi:hypothetical protein